MRYLPVFAGANGALSVAKVEQLKDLFLCNHILSLVILLILILSFTFLSLAL